MTALALDPHMRLAHVCATKLIRLDCQSIRRTVKLTDIEIVIYNSRQIAYLLETVSRPSVRYFNIAIFTVKKRVMFQEFHMEDGINLHILIEVE